MKLDKFLSKLTDNMSAHFIKGQIRVVMDIDDPSFMPLLAIGTFNNDVVDIKWKSKNFSY